MLALVIMAAPVAAQSHADVVAASKASLVAQGEMLNGPCGAFKIASEAARRLSGEGAGVLVKPSPTENNCILNGVGYAADIVMYRDGRIFDVLEDSGGLNGPTWNDKGVADPGLWRSAPLSGVTPPAPVIVPPAPIPTLDLSQVKSWIEAAAASTVQTLYAQNERMFANEQAEHAEIRADIKEASAKPGAVESTFSNRYVQIALGILGALATERAVK
jgi:hypothetical protein